MKRLLPLLLLLPLMLACAPATSNVGDNTVAPGKTADLELLEFDWSRTDVGNRILTGRVRNNTDKKFSLVTITFTLTNSAKEQVGTALDNTADLAPGSVWRFQAYVLQDSATTAQVSGLSAF